MQLPTGEPSMARRMASILTALGERDAQSVRELALRVGLPRSTVHRIVGQLIEIGFVEKRGSGLQLGLRVFELGQQVPQQRSLQAATSPFLQDLRDATRHTANLAILDGSDMVYVDRAPVPNSPKLPFRLGGRHPAHATAMGKAMMAHLPESQLDELLQAPLVALTPRTITDGARLRAVLVEIRSTGLATDVGETRSGVNCVASPILARDGAVLGAISITGVERPAALHRWGPVVRNAALNLTRVLRTAPRH